jgi:hypothetical protein
MGLFYHPLIVIVDAVESRSVPSQCGSRRPATVTISKHAKNFGVKAKPNATAYC